MKFLTRLKTLVARPLCPIRSPLRVDVAMLTHPGMIRASNEDVVAYVLPKPTDTHALNHGSLVMIADGMGGHAAGEVASALAVQIICQRYYEIGGSIPRALSASLQAANQAVYKQSQSDPECAGMGTTCTAIAIKDNTAYLAHVGDSRAYILRKRNFYQISVDHSLVAALVLDGTLTPQEAATSPDRNVILKALGTKPDVAPLIWDEGLELWDGDTLLLCSDGLTDLVADDTISHILEGKSATDACQALMDVALAAGGHDNISVGVVRLCSNVKADLSVFKNTRKVNIVREMDSVP